MAEINYKENNMPTNVAINPIYESYTMLHPDGSFMCHCNKKKADWYIRKELAIWQDEKKFKLRFEPNGIGKADSPYYTQKMENKCVVCGSEEDLNKHHVMPYVFRRRFPVEYKESNHHDVVAICVDCHEEYEGHATRLKQQIASECGVSMNTFMSPEQKNNKKILSARNILLKLKEGTLIDDNGNNVVLPEDSFLKLTNKANEELIDHEKMSGTLWADIIMDTVDTEEKMFNLIKRWREHFLMYAKPKFLPQYWNVNHSLEISKSAKNSSK